MNTLVIMLTLLLVSGESYAENATRTSQNLPEFGDSTSGIVSLKQEREIGQQFLRSLRAQAPTLDDPLIQDYLENLIYHLASYSQLSDRRLDVVLIKSPVINAFAAPGGIVGVNYGLFTYGETEHETAAILAHEIAHLSQRHFARGIESGKVNSMVNLAGLLASVVLMTTVGGEAGLALLNTTQGVTASKQMAHSRARESEADRVGIDTLVESDMNPRAMAHMFERLEQANRYSGKGMPEFLRTHPVTKSRISDSYNQTRQYPNKSWPLKLDYQLMRARVAAITTRAPQELIPRFKDGLNDADPVKRAASQYGLALVLARNSEIDEAIKYMRPLLDEYPNNIVFQIAEAWVHAEAQRYERALEILETSLTINPGNYPLTMAYAETLISADRPEDAQKILITLSGERENDDQIWYLLAEAFGLANNIPGVHWARAEYFVLNGNFDQAVKQLGFALPLVKGNFQQEAKLKQRIEEIWKMQAH